jgi:hypothetical protein
VCCGTKRLTEIRCPASCPYLTSAREHPPVVVKRQQQRDGALLVHLLRDLTQRQSELFLLVNRTIAQYEPPALQPLADADVADAASTLASTLETAARGVIYQHRATSSAGERLAAAIQTFIGQVGSGSAFERDAALVLRRIGEAVRDATRSAPNERNPYLALLGRVMLPAPGTADADRAAEPPRLIVP